MKKFALALMVASAALFGFGAVASAQYPTSLTVGTPSAGGPFASTYTNCVNGETITFSQPQSTPASISVVCAGRSATANFTNAPTATGTYTVTAGGPTSPARTQSFSISGAAATTLPATATTLPATGGADGAGAGVPATVPGAGLPATGSNGIGTSTTIAIGLLAVGFGLFAVAQVRRRQPNLA